MYQVGPNVQVLSLFGSRLAARGLRDGTAVLVPGTLKNVSTSKRPENSSAPKPFPVRNPFLGSFPLDFIFPRAIQLPVTDQPREILSGRSFTRMPCPRRCSDIRMNSPLMPKGPSLHDTSVPILRRLPFTKT